MDEIKNAKVSITYFTDPLCCWSWAFEENWQRLKQEFKELIEWRYCMGGLLPDWEHFNDTVNSINRPLQMGAFWMYVSKTANVAINHKIWYEDPPASSYPACVAVKCAELQSEQAADIMLANLRRSSMIEGINIAKKEMIMNIAEQISGPSQVLDFKQFAADFNSDKAMENFRQDLQNVRYNGITRFPTLLFRKKNRSSLLTGNISYEMLVNIITEA